MEVDCVRCPQFAYVYPRIEVYLPLLSERTVAIQMEKLFSGRLFIPSGCQLKNFIPALRLALLCSVEPSWIISTRRMIVARCYASLSRSLSSQPQRGPPASSSTARDCQPGLFFGHCLILENGNVRFDVV